MKTPLVAALLASSSLVFGCSGAGPSGVGSTGAAESTSSTKLSGTFEAVGTNDLNLPFYVYDFSSDGTYTATGGCKPTDGCHAISAGSGTWKIEKSGSNKKITFEDDNLGESSFYVVLDGNTLTLNKTLSGQSATFFNENWTKKIPSFGVCADDNGNSLGECDDSGNFACGDDGFGDNVQECTPLDG